MPRPKRKEIKLTHDSAVALMQEIYNECVEQRTTAIRIQNKMIGFMKEAADMSLIGPVLKEQQKIIDSAIDKKLQLSKLLATIASKNMEVSSSGLSIDGDIREAINELVTKTQESQDEGDNLNYKI
jgi:hypothetical protein|tara:strand:- start:3955 stop:4332 length:378 start_codon:yes stop_codon:yes gene_type:complete|eukprot:COSAG01_NODE_250_length_20331_cov_203.745700_11_plen_126_part_00